MYSIIVINIIFCNILGSELHIRGLVFRIVELDLWTYNYMNENKDIFTQDAILGAKCFLESKGLLNLQYKENVNNRNLITHEVSDCNKSFENTVIAKKIDQLNLNNCTLEL